MRKKCIERKERFVQVFYTNERTTQRYVNEPSFKDAIQLQDDLYEVEMSPKTVMWDLPNLIGFSHVQLG